MKQNGIDYEVRTDLALEASEGLKESGQGVPDAQTQAGDAVSFPGDAADGLGSR